MERLTSTLDDAKTLCRMFGDLDLGDKDGVIDFIQTCDLVLNNLQVLLNSVNIRHSEAKANVENVMKRWETSVRNLGIHKEAFETLRNIQMILIRLMRKT